MAKKVFLFLASGFEEVEAITPIDVLRRAGLEVIVVSISDELKVVGSHGIAVVADTLIKDVAAVNADLLVLPGGMPGTNNLNASDVLKKMITRHHAQKKLLAAICAAPIVLGDMGLLQGHHATCYPGHETRLTGATLTGKQVEVSLPFITGKGAGASMEFALEIVSQLLNRKAADDLAAKMMVVR